MLAPSVVVDAASSASRRSNGTRIHSAVWGLAIVGAAALLVLLGLGGTSPPAPYFGTRLGMSERAVRQHFESAARGSWTASGPSDEPVLRWTRTGPRPESPSAVAFEFNEGKVVAIRADLEADHPLAVGPSLEASFATVLARQPEADGEIRLTVLSRACSKHVAEAARLIAAGPHDQTAMTILPK